ncbi:MAG: sensor histidine kinase [Syntrophomonadaceae bacterium]
MIRPKSISSKIIISYLLVVFITFAMTVLAFYPALFGVLENRAQISLEKQAWEIAFLMQSHQSEGLPEETAFPSGIRLLGRPVESHYLLVNPDNRITGSSYPEYFPVGHRLSDLFLPLRDREIVDKARPNTYRTDNYIAVEIPIGISPENSGTVITFMALQSLRDMYLNTLYLVFGNLLIALVAALFIAYLLIGYIVRPLKNLELYAEAMGNRQFDIKLETRSNDELSNLAEAFNQMADRLKSYDESIRHFFQNASHELKTPLMSINGYVEGIRDGIFDGPAVDNALEIIHKESLRMRDIVENMIDITILDQPHSNYFLPHRLSYIVENALDSVGGYALDRKVAITADIPEKAIVVGDWDRLQSLFINLLSNAIRHAQNSVTIRSQVISDTQQVEITVQDDGPGFSSEDFHHAFEYFYTRTEGSGLGLAIARKIVDEHGGEIYLQNASPKGGAVVKVTLPSVSGDADGLV